MESFVKADLNMLTDFSQLCSHVVATATAKKKSACAVEIGFPNFDITLLVICFSA